MKEERSSLKNKVNTENENVRALTAEEAEQVTGSGTDFPTNQKPGDKEFHLYTIPSEDEMRKQFKKIVRQAGVEQN